MNPKRILLPVVILALGVAGFAALKATRPAPLKVTVAEPVWRVVAEPVKLTRAGALLTLNGRVENPRLTAAAAPAAGRVLRVSAREGERVRAGQVLLTLDPRDFKPRVEQARGQVLELEAALSSERLRHQADLEQLAQEKRLRDLAAADVERFQRLQQENFYSQTAVEQSRSSLVRQDITVRTRELAIADHVARLAQLEARLIQARATREEAELALQRSRVSAPFDGVVSQVAVAEGDQVNGGQALLRLYPFEGLEVRAKLPASVQDEFLDGLRRGEQAAAVLADGKTTLRLTRVSGAADARGLDAFFSLTSASAGNLPRVGELLSLGVRRAARDGVAVLPYAALYGGDRVYRIVEGRLQAVAVTLLGEAGGSPRRVLVQGAALQDGDRVLATHLPNAVSGLKVEVAR